MVEIIYKDDRPIGWKMCPKTEEEQKIAATVRDLTFFGFEETHIKYDGLELIEPEKGKTMGNIKSLTWIQKQYKKTY
jgi:hypothetical protein